MDLHVECPLISCLSSQLFSHPWSTLDLIICLVATHILPPPVVALDPPGAGTHTRRPNRLSRLTCKGYSLLRVITAGQVGGVLPTCLYQALGPRARPDGWRAPEWGVWSVSALSLTQAIPSEWAPPLPLNCPKAVCCLEQCIDFTFASKPHGLLTKLTSAGECIYIGTGSSLLTSTIFPIGRASKSLGFYKNFPIKTLKVDWESLSTSNTSSIHITTPAQQRKPPALWKPPTEKAFSSIDLSLCVMDVSCLMHTEVQSFPGPCQRGEGGRDLLECKHSSE